MSSSLADIKRAWLLRMLGLSEAAQTQADLETSLYNQNAGIATNRVLKTGRFYVTEGYGASANATLTLNNLYLMPFSVGKKVTALSIACNVSVAGGAGNTVRMGIYSSTDGVPETLVLGTDAVASTTTGIKSVAINQSLDPGLYWLGVVGQGGTAGSGSSLAAHNNSYVAHTAISAATDYSAYLVGGVSGALANIGVPSVSAAHFKLWLGV